jgi:4-alpha-glucanotransferase
MLSDALRRHAIDNDNLYAVAHFLARTRSRLLALSLEDLLNVADQPNIPGTVNEHPNWRQRLPVTIDGITGAIDLAALKQATGERTAGVSPT